MRLDRITWPQAEAYFRENDMVLLGVGSIESHGRHLCLGTDTLVPDRLLEMIEEQHNVLIAPTVPYGAADSLEEFPGTVNIGADLLYDLLSAITDNLYKHGARRFAILNGHGGNIRVIDQLGYDLQRRGAIVAELNWWLMAWDLDPAWTGGHGGGEETAAVMGIDPGLVDKSEIPGPMTLRDVSPTLKASHFNEVTYKGVKVKIPRITDSITKNGWIGPDHPETATQEWGKKMLRATADYIVDFLGEFQKVDIAHAFEPLHGYQSR